MMMIRFVIFCRKDKRDSDVTITTKDWNTSSIVKAQFDCLVNAASNRAETRGIRWNGDQIAERGRQRNTVKNARSFGIIFAVD